MIARVDDAKVGRALRQLRRRRGLRQVDVAALARLAQQTISLIECGHAAAFTIDTVRRAFGAVGASYEGLVVWRGGALDRLIEELGRKLDEKTRLARRQLCRERFGWPPTGAGRLLVLPDLDSARRAVARNAASLDRMFPARGPAVRQWLRRPGGDLSGILFVADTNPVGASAGRRGGQRVRRPRSAQPTLG